MQSESSKTPRNCLECGNAFLVYPSAVRWNGSRFCSRECVYRARKNQVSLTCSYCQAQFTRKQSTTRPGRSAYCSRACKDAGRRVDPGIRFWSHVVKSSTCWLWTGKITINGYGQFCPAAGKTKYAHRYSFELHSGLLLGRDQFVLHTCPDGDNKLCVNPAHLRTGTHLDNMEDARNRGQIPAGDRHYSHVRPEVVRRGAQNPAAKLTDAQVVKMRRDFKETQVTLTELAIRCGISRRQVSNILNGRAWRHLNP